MNMTIFVYHKPYIKFIVHHIIDQLQQHHVTSQAKLKRINIGSALVFEYLAGFFGGASANMPREVLVYISLSTMSIITT